MTAASWRRLLGLGGPGSDKPRIEVRLSCGFEIVLESDTAEPLFKIEEQLTDPRPGFTEIPASITETGERARINREHVTMVRVR